MTAWDLALVKLLNKSPEKWQNLEPRGKALILGGWKPDPPNNCIPTEARKVDANQGKFIQKVGEKWGCHSCGSRYPASGYHADHIVPQEFCTPYMEPVFEQLEIPYPETFELLPQCPRCSGKQGGDMAKITRLARSFANRNGIVVYEI